MYKSLFYSKLFVVAVLFVLSISHGTGQQEIYHDRSLKMSDLLSNELYHQVLNEIDPYEDMATVFELDQSKIISLLHTSYPDLSYELERTPKQALNGREILICKFMIYFWNRQSF